MNPAQSRGEAVYLAAYGLAATGFRVFICTKILLMLMERFFFVGLALSAAAVVAWVLVPLGRFLHYLFAGVELQRVRVRALGVTGLFVAAVLAGLGLWRVPDRWHVEGVVEPRRVAFIHARVDGFVRDVLPSGRRVAPGAEPLLTAENRPLSVEKRGLGHDRDVLLARQGIARRLATANARYLTLVQILQEDLDDLADQEEVIGKELSDLSIRAPFAGTWICDREDRLANAYVRRGEQVGMVADLDEVVVRARPTQRLAGMLGQEAQGQVEFRLIGRPAVAIPGRWRLLPAGREPSADAESPERRFDVEITPVGPGRKGLLAGQRVLVRFQMPSKCLLAQGWRWLRQLLQKRFRV